MLFVLAALFAALPTATGYIAGAACKPPERSVARQMLAFTEFPILSVLLGVSMYLSAKHPVALALHLALVAMLTAWISLAFCYGNTKEAVWLLVASDAVCLYAIVAYRNPLLLPIALWLSFFALLAAFPPDISRSKYTLFGS